MTTMERLAKEDPAGHKRLEEGCIVFSVKLPCCAVAAIALIGRWAGVKFPECDPEECNHPRLPEDYGQRFAPGTRYGQIIYAIECDSGMVTPEAPELVPWRCL